MQLLSRVLGRLTEVFPLFACLVLTFLFAFALLEVATAISRQLP